MIDLTAFLNYYYGYVEQGIVEIFNKYQWTLHQLGVQFQTETLLAIIDHPQDLESAFIAFIAWILYRKQQGDQFNYPLDYLLVEAIEHQWKPTPFQQQFLAQHEADLFLNSQGYYWEQAGQILGEKLRDQLLADITLDGHLVFLNHRLLSSQERQLIAQLQSTIKDHLSINQPDDLQYR